MPETKWILLFLFFPTLLFSLPSFGKVNVLFVLSAPDPLNVDPIFYNDIKHGYEIVKFFSNPQRVLSKKSDLAKKLYAEAPSTQLEIDAKIIAGDGKSWKVKIPDNEEQGDPRFNFIDENSIFDDVKIDLPPKIEDIRNNKGKKLGTLRLLENPKIGGKFETVDDLVNAIEPVSNPNDSTIVFIDGHGGKDNH